MHDKFILNIEDILTGLLPLLAAILAVMKDTTKQDKSNSRKKKLTRYGVVALCMASVGFIWSMYCTNENKIKGEARREQRDEYFRNIKETLDQELPSHIAKAIEDSQLQINIAVNKAVGNSKDGLQATLGQAIKDSKTELNSTLSKAITDSQGDIKEHFMNALEGSQKEIKKGMSDEIKNSKETIVSTVLQVVKDSQVDIKSSVSDALQNS